MKTSWDEAALEAEPLPGVTLGVAVAVPEPFAALLHQVRVDSGDPAAPAVPPHVTLVPPVVVAPAQVEVVVDHVRGCVADQPGFEVVLQGTGSFRPVSQVVFVQVVKGWDECDRIQEQVRRGPLQRRLGFPYHPHVTVAHDVPPAALDRAEATLADFEADFAVDHVSVYRCESDGIWRPLAHLPLAT